MKKFFPLLIAAVIVLGLGVYLLLSNKTRQKVTTQSILTPTSTQSPQNADPLSITAMKQKSYPGSAITIEKTLAPGSNYSRYLASYLSDGLMIYGLMTIPTGIKPVGGWPVILFNHGYIPPSQYSTDTDYAVMVDPLAAAGYIVFKPDYRGNGNSQGTPEQVYVSPGYITDSMNALSSIKQYKDANPNKIGVFGHSMGGNITLHELVISTDIKAAEIMAGVVGNETDILNWWNQRIANKSIIGNDLDTSALVSQMVKDHGTPQTDPDYWNSIDPTKYISNINVPVQIQVGSADADVPVNFSTSLRDSLESIGKNVDFHLYPGADHNLSPDTSEAMSQTITFFNRYLK